MDGVCLFIWVFNISLLSFRQIAEDVIFSVVYLRRILLYLLNTITIISQTKPTTMVNFNTLKQDEKHPILSHEQVLRNIPILDDSFKTVSLLVLFLFCFFMDNLVAQPPCNLNCPGTPEKRDLILDSDGNYTFSKADFVGLTSNCQLTPPPNPELDIWENSLATVSYSLPVTFSCNDVGTTLTLYATIEEGPGTKSGSCGFEFTILDKTPPNIQFPADITVSADANACAYNFTSGLEVDSVLENCSFDVSWNRSGVTLGSGTEDANGPYNVGTTVITWTVTDLGGNMVPGATVVTVTDDEAPQWTNSTLPDDETWSVVTSCDTTAMITHPSLTDNCTGAASLDSLILSGVVNDTVYAISMGGSMSQFFDIGTTTLTYYGSDGSNVITDVSTVTVNDGADPVFMGSPLPSSQTFSPSADCFQPISVAIDTVLDNCTLINSDSVSYTVDSSGVILNSGTGFSFMDTLHAGPYTITLTAQDSSGNVATHSFVYTITDTQVPTAICKTMYQASLDANGELILNGVDLDSLSDDNCGLDSFHIRRLVADPWQDTLQFDCSDIGNTTVLFRVMDKSGNVSSPDCMTNLSIVDDLPPVASCKDITVNLDATGNAMIADTDVDGSSSDNCATFLSFSITKDTLTPYTGFSGTLSFDCTEVGTNKVTLSVTDAHSNENFCFARVTVRDTIVPMAAVQDITVALDSLGKYWIKGAEIDNGSTDVVCGIETFKIGSSANGPFADSLMFDCDDLTLMGADTMLYLEVIDSSGNSDTSTVAMVEIIDDIAPIALCFDNIEISLDNSGMAIIDSTDIDSASYDNCNIVSRVLSKTSFGCVDAGTTQTIMLTATDQSGNPKSCSTTVSIVDDTPPVAACKANISVGLLPNGTVAVSPALVDAGSLDACDMLSITLEIAIDTMPFSAVTTDYDSTFSTNAFNFNCNHIGDNRVALRVTDGSMNSSTCTTIVHIQDNEGPVVTAPMDVTIECQESRDTADLGAALATDNCALDTLYYSDSSLTGSACTGSGTITRTWYAKDVYGNVGTDEQTITLIDTTAPVFIAPVDTAIYTCQDAASVAEFKCFSDSRNVQKTISITSVSTVRDTISISDSGRIVSVKVVDLDVEHTDVNDLRVRLIFRRGGVNIGVRNLINFNTCALSPVANIESASFEDDATLSLFTCLSTDIDKTFRPFNPFSSFVGENVNGDWILDIRDNDGTGDGGNLKGWGLEICYITEGDTTVTQTATVMPDNCDIDLEAEYTDLHAFKGFKKNTVSTPTTIVTKDFDFTSTWDIDSISLVTINSDSSAITLDADTDSGNSHYVNIDGTMNPIDADGWISFDYTSTMDVNDTLKYFVNGDSTVLGMTGTPVRVVVPVSTGDILGFIQGSDNLAPHRQTVISNFVFADEDVYPAPADDCASEFSIARIWQLEDDCGNAAADQLQIITTQDTTKPVFTHPDTLTILATGTTCTPWVEIDMTTFITEECELDSITNTALDDYSKGNGLESATGFYAPGTYDITFYAKDVCGNVGVHEVVVQVMDAQNPTAVCQDVNIQLDNTGTGTVLAASINNGSTDNCGIVDMYVTPNTFTSSDIGPNPVTLTVEDAAGQTNTCPAIVTVLGGVGFTAGNASGLPGGTALVAVTVDSFNAITFFEYNLNLVVGSVGAINALQNINPALGAVTFNPATGFVSWIDSGSPPTGVTLASGTKLFDVEVNISPTATIGSSSPIEIINTDAGAFGITGSIPSYGISGIVSVVDNTAPMTIAGDFKTELGSDIDSVTVYLSGTLLDTIETEGNTVYSFNNVPNGGNATIKPARDRNWRVEDGTQLVSTADVFLIHQHAALLDTLPTPYKIIAADANKSGSVTTADVFLVHQLAVGVEGPIASVNDSWRFIDAGQSLPWPNTFSITLKEDIDYPIVNTDYLDTDFIGVKIGDVTNSVEGIFFGDNEEDFRSGDAVKFVVDDMSVAQGELITVGFSAKDFEKLLTYQATLNFDAEILELVEATPSDLPNLNLSNFNMTKSAEGLMAFNWYHTSSEGISLHDGHEVFALTFNVLEDASSLSELLTITNDYIPIESMVESREIIDVELAFEGVTSVAETGTISQFRLYQNRPNPFSNTSFIGFDLPERSPVSLTILDPTGRVLQVVEGEFSAGYHQVLIDKKDLPVQGVLFYRLETPAHQAIRKMILLD